MTEALYSKIFRLLDNRQLSISGITRDLKSEGIDEHRLIMTGYLRALRDLKKLDEIEVPPSKTYKLPDNAEKEEDNIYSLIGHHLKDVPASKRIYVAIYVFSSLLERPVFRAELKSMGFHENTIMDAVQKGNPIIEIPEKDIKILRNSITRISIPSVDPAYEISGKDNDNLRYVGIVLLPVLKALMNLEGLVPKTKQTKLAT
ncbi:MULTISPECIES: hypothetical protein [Methanohalophilus]|jgi:hypothetical protein|uniref:Uncharacterized protein n=1 Tax=Methanohalophilus euhalobius TaxID=51203 RepID=A0A285G997_9EURY|nr:MULTISPECIES: hypothetical protein [Methanohalophilus]KXS46322.1 MAG: hypothetical protein AWU58_653 [Methanohalophilus sp. T328-1]RSD34227.1 MAG: hypothetical protein CI953_1006 [Methanohalophilus sp.]OBZ35600.1 MAG: hypothetical protein A9957_00595 [Methanohalophilus sp. DAL1]ODV49260.1 MAG: hypothetical protein A8273_1407 [Methanohalophilus sp. 2-GBenrich]PQV42055.1 hypothetical protein B0H22_11030 [Methanohalophilus euhalobius]